MRDLVAAMDRFDLGREDRPVLEQAERDLIDLFRLVVLGEFNAGKSAMLNALLGQTVLAMGATPTTQVVQVIRYSEEPYERYVGATLLERGLPVEWLRDISLVDTPGTNAILREHERITREFVPRADLVLFVTSVDRPFTESERAFLERIRDWGKKVVLILNKADLLSEAELNEVQTFVRSHARALLQLDPPVFPVSARRALAAREIPDEDARKLVYHQSGFDALESYIFETLDDRERLRLKLLTPLGVVLRLNDSYRQEAEGRLSLLREDVRTLETIDQQVETFQAEMRRDAEGRVHAVENVIHELNARADRFFEETVRLGRLSDLLRTEKIRELFERDVIADTSTRIDHEVGDLVDWLVSREGRFWNDVFEYLERRRQAGDERLIGRIGGQFQERRRELLGAIGQASQRVVDSFDREKQTTELAISFRDALAQTALAEVGAISLGALVAILVGTVAADVTGILAATVFGGLALFILPLRRNRARKEFHQRTDALRERLLKVLNDQIEGELAHVEEQLHQSVAPYSRFVETERARLTELTDRLTDVDNRARVLRTRLDKREG